MKFFGGPGGKNRTKPSRNPPANGPPFQTRLTKFSRFRALIAVGLSGTNRDDPRIDEGKDQVARCDLPHGFIEGISSPIGVSLGRPEVATSDLLPEWFWLTHQ